MRGAWCFFAIVLLFVACIEDNGTEPDPDPSAAITISYPTSSTVWRWGESVEVRWSGAEGSEVHLDIYKGGDYLDEFHPWTANDGVVGLTGAGIASEWGTGSDYKLKIEDRYDNYGWSPQFAIVSE